MHKKRGERCLSPLRPTQTNCARCYQRGRFEGCRATQRPPRSPPRSGRHAAAATATRLRRARVPQRKTAESWPLNFDAAWAPLVRISTNANRERGPSRARMTRTDHGARRPERSWSSFSHVVNGRFPQHFRTIMVTLLPTDIAEGHHSASRSGVFEALWKGGSVGSDSGANLAGKFDQNRTAI